MPDDIEDLAEKIVEQSWWKLLKRLPLDGGPSSTKFVYLATSGAITVCLVLVTLAFCGVYAFTHDHIASGIVAALLASTLTAVIGFAANSQNQRRALNAQADAGQTGETTIAPTPLTTEAVPVAPQGERANG
jgi:hypothetical protein